jgi:hypothetical protein
MPSVLLREARERILRAYPFGDLRGCADRISGGIHAPLNEALPSPTGLFIRATAVGTVDYTPPVKPLHARQTRTSLSRKGLEGRAQGRQCAPLNESPAFTGGAFSFLGVRAVSSGRVRA